MFQLSEWYDSPQARQCQQAQHPARKIYETKQLGTLMCRFFTLLSLNGVKYIRRGFPDSTTRMAFFVNEPMQT
jgi:hypothetical protein